MLGKSPLREHGVDRYFIERNVARGIRVCNTVANFNGASVEEEGEARALMKDERRVITVPCFARNMAVKYMSNALSAIFKEEEHEMYVCNKIFENNISSKNTCTL